MKLTLCGSMVFAKEMIDMQKQLDEIGHDTYIPGSAEICSRYLNGAMDHVEQADDKIENDWMGKHMDLILSTDGVLVLNYDKKGKKNYIGGNSFVEMVFAKYFNRDVYLLNDIPEISPYKDEIIACQPIILNGDLSKIRLDKGHKTDLTKAKILENSHTSLQDSMCFLLGRLEGFRLEK